MESEKPVHTIVLDTGSIIKNEPPVSTLLSQCESLVSIPAVISEIKDAATRSRVETTLQPFLSLRTPSPTSLKFVTDFARRTGDLAALSNPDLQIIALTYEIECERNGGDWRLRRVPGQRKVNGPPPTRMQDEDAKKEALKSEVPASSSAAKSLEAEVDIVNSTATDLENSELAPFEASGVNQIAAASAEQERMSTTGITSQNVADLELKEDIPSDHPEESTKVDSAQNSAGNHEDSDSDSEGWITPSNLKKKQAEDAGVSTVQTPEPKTMQVAALTTDFAMQNVILQMNLNLLSPSLTRVKHLKTFVLRCHACFQVTKDMSKQFCPKCGQPSLTRVSCSTNANGEFKLHLKKNMQWSHRGDKYSIPKPVHGSANGRMKGGGKGGWGNELILAEDQKEYQRAVNTEKRQKERNLMDEDYLPGILTGDRGKAGGRIKIGAGRNVNSKKR